MKVMKPDKVTNCKNFRTCESGKWSCVGCNVWNYLYDSEALIDWCKKQGKDVMLFTKEMHRELK